MKIVPYELEEDFERLVGMVSKSKKNLTDRISPNDLYEALPIQSFDVLPAFSTAKLFLFLSDINERVEINKIFTSPLYYVCLRSILNYCNEENISKLHPVVLYHCYKGLENTYSILKNNIKITNQQESDFKKTIKDIGARISKAGKFEGSDLYENIGLNTKDDMVSTIVKNEGNVGKKNFRRYLKKNCDYCIPQLR